MTSQESPALALLYQDLRHRAGTQPGTSLCRSVTSGSARGRAGRGPEPADVVSGVPALLRGLGRRRPCGKVGQEDAGLSRELCILRTELPCAQMSSLRAGPGALQGNLAVLPPAAGPPLCRAERSPAFHLCGPGELLGVMFVMFPGSPSRKTSLKHRGFPSAGIQMNPKQSALQSGR